MMGSIIPLIVRCRAEPFCGSRALRCSLTFGSPNKSLQRSGTHKLLGRGRSVPCVTYRPFARVLNCRRAAAELSR
jgi:hypothetical protein